MKGLLIKFLNLLPAKVVFAHCDIPCGIYDPHQAQLAAHTVIRMTQLFKDAKQEKEGEEAHKELAHKLMRYTRVKDEHAEIIKHEIRIIWGDYFKDEHLKANPDLHDLVWKILKLASKARQEVNMEAAQELLANIQKFAEIFWKTKNVKTARIPAPYPSGGEIIVPVA